MKLKLYYIPLVLVIFCMAFAVVVRFSYTDEGDKIYEYKYVSDSDITDLDKEYKIKSSDDLFTQADVIVKAKYNGEREVTTDAFYSDVEVLNVYKGDRNIKGKSIHIIEPTAVFTENNYINASGTFLIPMQKGEEYIILLKHMQFEPKRNLDDFQKSLYYPVTKGAFGCYRISDKLQTELIDPNKTYNINSLKGKDIFTSDQKALDTYNEYKTDIFNRMGVKLTHK